MTARTSAFLLDSLMLVLGGCGSGEKAAGGDPSTYPLVTEGEPKFQRPVTSKDEDQIDEAGHALSSCFR